MSNISFQFPAWYILVCLLAAAGFTAILYLRQKSYSDKPTWLRLSLYFLRFASIFLIGLLLLGPMIKTNTEDVKNPIIAILFDDSKSVGHWIGDKAQEDFKTKMTSLNELANGDRTLDYYAFSDKIISQPIDSLNFAGDISNISQALKYISDVYEGDNLSAVIVASDGIFNEGRNPVYDNFNFKAPVLTIALGDTLKRKDVLVRNVQHNAVAYLNDEMLTQVDVQSFNTSAQSLRLIVEKELNNTYQEIFSQVINVNKEDFFTTVPVRLNFKESGINHYRYKISQVQNESNYANNVKDIYIDVLDARLNISIIAATPHPDLASLKQILEKNVNYEIKLFLKNPSNEELINTDLAILHDIPGANGAFLNVIQKLNERKIPRVFILGDQVDLTQFNKVQNQISINGTRGNTNEAHPTIQSDFKNFIISEELQRELKRYPPLTTPFGEYKVNANIQTFLYQSIGGIKTNFPLLSYGDADGIKTCYLFGTGIWRWKLFDYLEYKNFDLISELLDKSVIYTTTKEDKRKFRVINRSNIYNENEEISFSAELYNNNYELINSPEVSLKITNKQLEEFPFTFSKFGRTYRLECGKLPAGNYNYVAETNFNGQKLEEKGRFQLREVQFELYDLTARHEVLRSLSFKYGGQVYMPDQLEQLKNDLANNDQMKPVIYQSDASSLLLNFKILFFLIALFLGLEWFLRRYFGRL